MRTVFTIMLMTIAGFSFGQNRQNSNNSSDVAQIGTGNPTPTFSVYPNPVRSTMHIRIENVGENATYSLVNMVGKVVSTEKITGDQMSVDVSSLNDGIYILQITDVNGSTSKKVLVSKQMPMSGSGN